MKTRYYLGLILAITILLGGSLQGSTFFIAEANEAVISMDVVPSSDIPEFSQRATGNRSSDDILEKSADDYGRAFDRLASRDYTPPIVREKIISIDVVGLVQVVPDHVLSVVNSKVGDQLNEVRLTRDADAIFDLGFFADVDYRIVDKEDGAHVTFVVEENPVVEDIRFFGNTVFDSEALRSACFTQPGMIFNRQFFRNDLQRIKEKYQHAGYVMARISDVRIDGPIVNVYITEPRIDKIILQGNKRTRSYVIMRQLSIKEGDLFNAIKLRHTLGRLQGLGYFGDVNVGFENNEDPEKITVILTVEEAKTGRLGISIGYGSQSGWGGGINYNDSNWQGRGHNVGIGFELGDREQYWLSYEQPFMDHEVFTWRVGAYKRSWKNLSRYIEGREIYRYDETRKGAYMGLGRKFSEGSKFSWFLVADWHEVDALRSSEDITIDDRLRHELDDENTRNFSTTLSLQRNNIDPYVPYSKGSVQAIHIEKGFDGLGGNWDYWKYWTEMKWFIPLDFLSKYVERTVKITDVPPLLAMRVRAGTSSGGYLPWGQQFVIGGDSTMRGLKDEYYRGNRMFLSNLELRIPVQKSFSVVAFYDMGKAWNTYLGENFDLGDLSSSYGFGVRVKTPMGNMRLDIAQGEEENRVHFGFGEMF